MTLLKTLLAALSGTAKGTTRPAAQSVPDSAPAPGKPLVKDEAPISVIAATEAVQTLGLLTPSAISTIVEMLATGGVEHPRAICTAFRKAGDQISDEQKRELGIRRNGFLSRHALDEITATGRADPLAAHEITLLRATFTVGRDRTMRQFGDFPPDRDSFRGWRHDVHNKDCPPCNRLDGITTQTADVKVIPPSDCIPTCTANYFIRADVDWLANLS